MAVGRDRLRGIVTEVGTRTSHTAILARAMQIPCVLGVEGLLTHAVSGQRVVVDGQRGTVTRRPTDEDLEKGALRSERQKHLASALRVDLARPTTLASGEQVSIGANLELAGEATLAATSGADGVGLYRTEYLYADRTDFPSEDEQAEQYASVVRSFDGRPVTMRTFDVGADKHVPSFALPPERNPALGLRAVRIALIRPGVFETQLRAMIRASAFGDVRVMVPMIATLREVHEVEAAANRGLFYVGGQPRSAQALLDRLQLDADASIGAAQQAQGGGGRLEYGRDGEAMSPALAHALFAFALLPLLRGGDEDQSNQRNPLEALTAYASDERRLA